MSKKASVKCQRELTQAGDRRSVGSWNAAEILHEGRDVHSCGEHEQEAVCYLSQMPPLEYKARHNVPSSKVRGTEEVEDREHDHEERVGSEGGCVDEVRI